METIVLSIKPEYVEKIFSGIKQYEYRKKLARRLVNRIIIYATKPLMQVVGEVQVLGDLSGSPTSLWEQTKRNAGICRAKYRMYFEGCKTANAYCLGSIFKYNQPKRLIDFGIQHPPQSFIYLSSISESRDLHTTDKMANFQTRSDTSIGGTDHDI